MKYFFQLPGGRPIEWPSRKPLTLYFAAVGEYFGIGRLQAELALHDRVLTDRAGRRFFALRTDSDGVRLQ
jgi:hypothetical protein